MNDTMEHEAVKVAKLDAAKFIINHFDCNAKGEGKKPAVYTEAIEYISAALTDSE